jgi:hypothetical protein
LHARHTLEGIDFFYVLFPGEPCEPGENVLSPIKRPRGHREIVTPIEGIQFHFFFAMIDANTLWMRQLSCHCDECMRAEYKACENEEAGEWKVVKIIKMAGARGNAETLRSAKSALNAKRRAFACSAVVDQLEWRVPMMLRASAGGCVWSHRSHSSMKERQKRRKME